MAGDASGGLRAFIEAAQANVKRLGSCRGGHLFTRMGDEAARPGRRFECSKCGGQIDWGAMYWYKLGLEHGKGSQ